MYVWVTLARGGLNGAAVSLPVRVELDAGPEVSTLRMRGVTFVLQGSVLPDAPLGINVSVTNGGLPFISIPTRPISYGMEWGDNIRISDDTLITTPGLNLGALTGLPGESFDSWLQGAVAPDLQQAWQAGFWAGHSVAQHMLQP